MQLARQLGSLYSIMPAASEPSLWSRGSTAASRAGHEAGDERAGAGAGTGTGTGSGVSDETKASPASQAARSGPSSSLSQMLSLLVPLSSLLGGSYGAEPIERNGQGSVTHAAPSSGAVGHPKESGAGHSALSSTMAKIALAGWTSNALTSLVEYFIPAVYETVSRSGLSKRRKADETGFLDSPSSNKLIYHQQQQQQLQSRASQSSQAAAPAAQSSANPKQVATAQSASPSSSSAAPPTPCQSSEEYISPTFARNYQGTWKYVVQIPHEGYFTQTIQRTSCVKQKCDFTEGSCHESPRWVSLLVAEIYYPDAVFNTVQQQYQQHAQMMEASEMHGSHPGALSLMQLHSQQQPHYQQQQQQMKQQQQQQLGQQQLLQQRHLQVAPSHSAAARPRLAAHDPLQMIDTSNSNNYNLNSLSGLSNINNFNAYLAAATELGSSAAAWDPATMAQSQQLAGYQMLQQRNALDTQPAESVASPVYAVAPPSPQRAQQSSSPGSAQLRPQQMQQIQPRQHANLSPLSNRDYIIALAAAALQQNPNMDINELLASLHLAPTTASFAQVNRKRRDVLLASENGSGSNINSAKMLAHSSSIANAQSANGQFAPTQKGKNQLQANELAALTMNLNGKLDEIGSNQISDLAFAGQIRGDKKDQLQQQQQQQTSSGSGNKNNGSANNQQQNQVDCDGHDKIGCYVVRVYYDWFLVNGSCKCWKTSPQAAGGATSAANNFLRRIFTG